MARRSKSNNRPQHSVVTRNRSQQPAYRRTRVRPYRELRVDIPDAHYPSRLPRRLTYKEYLKNDKPQLPRSTTPLPKPPVIYQTQATFKDPNGHTRYCRNKAIRRSVLFASGYAGTGGRLPRHIRLRRATNYRNAAKSPLKCTFRDLTGRRKR